jgi:Phage integrase, N-terminal SAM-like domain
VGHDAGRATAAKVRVRKTRDDVHAKWIKLQGQARQGAIATRIPTLGEYLPDWLKDVVVPNSAPSTAANYATFVRLYILPTLASKRLDKLLVREVQTWLNRLRVTCQCCAQRRTPSGTSWVRTADEQGTTAALLLMDADDEDATGRVR